MEMTAHQIKKKTEDLFEATWRERYGKKAYVHRLPDTADIRARNKGWEKPGHTVAHLPRQPSDYLVTTPQGTHYAEVKGTMNKEKLAYSRFEPSQLAGMTQVNEAGGEYLVYIYNLILQTWYVIPGRTILLWMGNGYKSFNFSQQEYLWATGNAHLNAPLIL